MLRITVTNEQLKLSFIQEDYMLTFKLLQFKKNKYISHYKYNN